MIRSVVYLSGICRERGFGWRDLGQNVRCASGPDEWLGIDVVLGNVEVDRQFQLCDAEEAVAPDALVGDVAKEALNHVQPRCAGGREVDDKARVSGQPLLHFGMVVRGVVVHDQMQAQVFGRFAVDQAQ